jgi:hypothetical protein
MPVQSFLPILDPRRKQLHGMVAISSTDFDGTEEEFTISSHDYPIVKYTPVVSQTTQRPWYMALTMTYNQIVREDYKSIPGFIPIDDVLPGQWWTSSSIGSQKREDLGALINGLIYSFGGNFEVVVPADPELGGDTVEMIWVASVPFFNQPQCTFFDLNWVEALQLTNPLGSPVNAIITSVTDGNEDPQDKVKAVVVMKGQPALNVASYNTIRLIRMPNQVLAEGDEFLVNLNIVGQNGFEELGVQIQVTII